MPPEVPVVMGGPRMRACAGGALRRPIAMLQSVKIPGRTMARGRSRLSAWFGGALAMLAIAAPAQAAWPERPITIIVHFAPGGANDLLGRLIAAELAPVLGQGVVVENRPGANGN